MMKTTTVAAVSSTTKALAQGSPTPRTGALPTRFSGSWMIAAGPFPPDAAAARGLVPEAAQCLSWLMIHSTATAETTAIATMAMSQLRIFFFVL